jgi:hypothetical protein
MYRRKVCSTGAASQGPTTTSSRAKVCGIGSDGPIITSCRVKVRTTDTTKSRAVIQEIPCPLWRPKVHYRVHKNPLLASILSHMNPVHTLPPYFPKTRFNIILPRTPKSQLSERHAAIRYDPVLIPGRGTTPDGHADAGSQC